MRKSTILIILGVFLALSSAALAHDTATSHQSTSIAPVANHTTDNTNYFDILDIATADGSADGQGIQACGVIGWDGSNYQQLSVDASGNLNIVSQAGSSSEITKYAAPGDINTGATAQTTDFDLNAAATDLRLLGITVMESASTASVAEIVIRHSVVSGGNCTGDPISFISLSANESVQIGYGDRGRDVASGVCVDVVSGEVDANSHTVVEGAP